MSVHQHWLLRFYPSTWRARYGDEFEALLEQYPFSPTTIINVLLGALDAHIAPQDTNGRILQMINRPRRTAVTVFCAYIAFVVSGLGFNKMAEDAVKSGLGTTYPAIGIAYTLVEVGAVVALLAVLAGGLPIAYVALRQALAERRRDILLLFAVPPIALALWLGYTFLLLSEITRAVPHVRVHDPLNVALFLSWVGLFGLAALASTAAVSVAVSRSQISARLFRFALAPAAVATLAMALMFGAVLAWGLSLRAYVPQMFNGNSGLLATNTAISWVGHVVVMGLATLVAAIALIRAYRSPGDVSLRATSASAA